jgi:AcrR family transcriptional regulator
MSEITASPARRRRADAERSRTAILEAGIRTLNARPDANIGQIASAAGVSRQTVYAHFASREALITAIVEQATAEALAAIDQSGIDADSPVEAMSRVIERSWVMIRDYPLLLSVATQLPASTTLERHEPVLARLGALIERGQASGDFDQTAPVSWFVATVVAIGDAAGQEVRAGRLDAEAAVGIMRRAVLRLLSPDLST